MSVKKTTDIQDRIHAILEKISLTGNRGYGSILNNALACILMPPPKAKKELREFTIKKLRILYKQMDDINEQHFQYEYMEEAQFYRNFLWFLNGGKDMGIDDIDKEPEMVRTMIKNGYFIHPRDWIILNEDDALQCSHVIVVAINPGRIIKEPLPHFVFYSERETVPYEKGFYRHIDELCQNKWGKFKVIKSKERYLEADPENPGEYLNLEECLDAPQIGYFDVYVKGDKTKPKDFQAPYGAMIIRTGGDDDEDV